MPLKIIKLIHIISIIHFDQEVLAFLKMKGDIDCGYKLGVEVVKDALRLTNFLSLIALDLPDYAKWVSLGGPVQVW